MGPRFINDEFPTYFDKRIPWSIFYLLLGLNKFIFIFAYIYIPDQDCIICLLDMIFEKIVQNINIIYKYAEKVKFSS